MTEEDQDDVTEHLEADDFVLNETDSFAYDFSNQEFLLEKPGFIGRVAILTVADQEYAIGYYYPEEFADGFSLRSDLIIENIVWHDSID